MQCLLANFSHGNGPYLRVTELALALNAYLASLNKPRLKIIIPWVYGERQQRIMREEFSDWDEKYPGEILLDAKLGGLVKPLIYQGSDFQSSLRAFIKQRESVQAQIHAHLKASLDTFNLAGEKQNLEHAKIELELCRNPMLLMSGAPAYSSTFGHVSEILESSLELDHKTISLDRSIIQSSIVEFQKIEKAIRIHFMATPGTFSYRQNRKPKYKTEIPSPPTVKAAEIPSNGTLENGIYITVSGIEGLENLFKDASQMGLKIYSNAPDHIDGATYAPPSIAAHPAIALHFARSGWGTIWAALNAGKPLVLAPFKSSDDPEIHFNNICAEKLGLGVIYSGQSAKELADITESLKKRMAELKTRIKEQFDTLDGNAFCAKRIVEAHWKQDSWQK